MFVKYDSFRIKNSLFILYKVEIIATRFVYEFFSYQVVSSFFDINVNIIFYWVQ